MSGIESRRCYASLGTGNASHFTGRRQLRGPSPALPRSKHSKTCGAHRRKLWGEAPASFPSSSEKKTRGATLATCPRISRKEPRNPADLIHILPHALRFDALAGAVRQQKSTAALDMPPAFPPEVGQDLGLE